MTRCAELLNTHIEVDFVDINSGCPIDLVYKKVQPTHRLRVCACACVCVCVCNMVCYRLLLSRVEDVD